MEFAYTLANYGVAVTVMENRHRVLPNEDVDISHEITDAYRKLGLTMLTGVSVASVTETPDAVTVAYHTFGSAASHALTVDILIRTAGFAPNTHGYGLDALGISTDARTGGVIVNQVMQTNVPGIYAVGDVTAKLSRAHVAETQGTIAAETIAGAPTFDVRDYKMIPRVTHCQPRVASFGLTEAQAGADAVARGSGFAVAQICLSRLGRHTWGLRNRQLREDYC